MKKEKKKKIQEVCQIIGENDSPIIITAPFGSWSTYSIDKSRTGKIFKSKGSCISHIRTAMNRAKAKIELPKNVKTQGEAGVFKINNLVVTKEDWIFELLKLKIQIFQPAYVEDMIFHLDKI
jgi:hypothetical protein